MQYEEVLLGGVMGSGAGSRRLLSVVSVAIRKLFDGHLRGVSSAFSMVSERQCGWPRLSDVMSFYWSGVYDRRCP